jgi:acyl-CoA thioesterase-1
MHAQHAISLAKSIGHRCCYHAPMNESQITPDPLRVLREVRLGVLALLLAALAGCSSNSPSLTALADDATILAFGDSLTFGNGAKPHESYPAVLAALSGRTVVNRGVSGEVTSAGLKRLGQVLDTVKPQLMVLCHGGNDMLQKKNLNVAADNITKMIAEARARNVEVVLLGVPKLGLLLSSAEFYNEVAQRTGVPYDAETLASILAKSDLKSDAVHPNTEGYRQIAQAVHALLRAEGAL